MAGTRKKLLKGLNFLLFLSIGIVLLFFAFRGIQFSSFWKDLADVRYEWVILSIFIGIGSHLVRAARWKLLFSPLGYHPGLKHTFWAVMTGYLANYAFPRIGEITRCAALNRTDKIPVDKLLGTVVVERAIDLGMLIILLFVVFFAKMDFFGSFIREKIFDPALYSLKNGWSDFPGFWIILLSLFVSAVLGFYIFRNQLVHIKAFSKLKHVLKSFWQGFKSVFIMENRGRFVAYTLLMWFLYLLTTWLVFFSAPGTAMLNPLDALFILVFGTIGITLPVQGGFGTYHLLVCLGLSLYGIPKEEGMVYAILSHESQTLMILLIGGISMFLVFFGKRKPSVLTDQSS